MKIQTRDVRLIETDEFPFEFLSRLAERESWRKELHRPVYHVHKWWANRLGSVFRGILLGSLRPGGANLPDEFYRYHSLTGLSVFDPFMGSGTTIGEAHKLGLTALGRDINPVAVEAVRTALGPLDRRELATAFEDLSEGVATRIRALYRSADANGRPCDVLYYFWVMQASCPACHKPVDLFSSHIIARNAFPDRRPEVRVHCPACGDIFPGVNGNRIVRCQACHCAFDPTIGPAKGAKAACPHCTTEFRIIDAVGSNRPAFRLYAKLVLTGDGRKEYLAASPSDLSAYDECSRLLHDEVKQGHICLPDLRLAHGYNTRQAMRYNFRSWVDFFNDRQLLALGWLHEAIGHVDDEAARRALMMLFSGALEFNNLFASYKGEGTGAVRHMFSHHILKPERMPIEANVWGTPRSSGGFSNLFRSRLLRMIDYRKAPTEVNGARLAGRVCSDPFSGKIEAEWPVDGRYSPRALYLSLGDSARSGLSDKSIDLIVTDPPFFDNVHYSELADFFFAWQRLYQSVPGPADSTRNPAEVQDTDPDRFAAKLLAVFRECHRVLKDEGLLVFTYHHSRNEGWHALALAILGAGFLVVNSQPVKAEMSVATPKSQAKEPIQLDIIIVCRKRDTVATGTAATRPLEAAIEAGRVKLRRLADEGFTLSRNDRRVVLYGQLLTAISDPSELAGVLSSLEEDVQAVEEGRPTRRHDVVQPLLFDDMP
jgi:putative DNA methylase